MTKEIEELQKEIDLAYIALCKAAAHCDEISQTGSDVNRYLARSARQAKCLALARLENMLSAEIGKLRK